MRIERVVKVAVVSVAGLAVAGFGLSMAAASSADTVRPQTAITSNQSDIVGPNDVVSVAFIGADDTTAPGALSFECAVDAAAFAGCTSPVSVGPMAGGAHQLAVRARDQAGNVDSAPATATWTVDSQPPTVRLDPPGGQQKTLVSFRGSDDHTRPEDLRFECANSNTRLSSTPTPEPTFFGPCTSPAAYGAMLSQSWFKVRAIDSVGNVGPAASLQAYTLDSEVAPVQILSGPVDHTPDTTAVFALKGSDRGIPSLVVLEPITRFVCTVDGAAQPCASDFVHVDGSGPGIRGSGSGSLTLVGLAPGHHVLGVMGSPGDEAVRYWDWNVDTAAPVTAITSVPPAASPTAAGLVAFTAQDDQTHRERVAASCSLDGVPFAACTSPVVLPGLPAGPHRLAVRATDEAGNTGAAATATWTAGATPPTTSTTVPMTSPSCPHRSRFPAWLWRLLVQILGVRC